MLKALQSRKLYAFVILATIAILVGILELSEYWFGDNTAYGFYPYLYNNIKRISELLPVNTIQDVIDANNQNYLSVNGRYVAHFFVILFCGILGKGLFAICNALVWIVFVVLLMRVSNRKLSDIPSLLVGTALSLYFMVFIGSGPASQINYVWMFSLTLGWLLLFRRMKGQKNILMIILLGFFSLIAGNGQEGANIGISGALLVLLFVKKFRFTPAEWVMGICFGIGCLADCLAPGTLFRSGSADGGSIAFRILQFTWIARDYFSIPILFLALVIALSKSYNRRQFSQNWFIWCALGVSVIFILVLGSRSWNQYFGMMLFISILILRIWTPGTIRNILSLLILSWCLYSLYGKYTVQITRGEYLSTIESQYNASPDGVVFIDASNPICIDLFSNHKNCFVLNNGQKKPITILPSEIKGIEGDSIVNFVKPYSDNRFLIVQSKIRPNQFIYNLSFRCCGYIRPISNSQVDFATPLYQTDTYQVLHINGYPFLHHEITMVESTDE